MAASATGSRPCACHTWATRPVLDRERMRSKTARTGPDASVGFVIEIQLTGASRRMKGSRILGARHGAVNAGRVGGRRGVYTRAMPPASPQSGRAPWIALATFAALALGLVIAWQQAQPPRRASPAIAADSPHAPAIDEALVSAAPVDSAALKQRWQDETRGVDVSDLDSRKLELYLRFANAAPCTCGCGYTLAGCRASDMTCDVSGDRLLGLADSIRTGRITSARGIRSRPSPGG